MKCLFSIHYESKYRQQIAWYRHCYSFHMMALHFLRIDSYHTIWQKGLSWSGYCWLLGLYFNLYLYFVILLRPKYYNFHYCYKDSIYFYIYCGLFCYWNWIVEPCFCWNCCQMNFNFANRLPNCFRFCILCVVDCCLNNFEYCPGGIFLKLRHPWVEHICKS